MRIRREKISFFESVLADFHRKAGREHLPWRKRGVTAYGIWVSEIMLQQTQVSRVIPYYEKFLERFPTVESLAGAPWEAFLPYYQGLGYYARGRNMLKAAKVVVEEYDGKFPRDAEVLQRLPGVGPYTAAAIASFAYGKNTIAWDTNLRRVALRFFFGSKRFDLSLSLRGSLRPRQSDVESRGKKRRSLDYARDDNGSAAGMTGQEYLETSFSLPAKTLNAAMMDFGSAICTARPKCGACPLSSSCVYFKESGAGEIQKSKIHARPAGGENQKSSVDWKNARVFVTLHENHKKYYSPYKTKCSPFVVPATHNTRAGIKDWFRSRYGLELSVRPPQRKEIIDGKPTLFVNAQILSGKPSFAVFSKDAISRARKA